MILDALTLLFVFALLQLLQMVMIGALWMANRRIPGLGWWAVGLFVQVAGMGLGFLQGTDVSRFFSFYLLNVATWFSAVTIYAGACRFRGVAVRWRWITALVLFAAVAYAWFLWGNDLLQGRVVVTAILMGFCYVGTGVVMWGETRPSLRMTARLLTVGLGAAAAVMVARIVLWSVFPEAPWANGNAPMASNQIVAGIVLLFTWVFFVVMLVTCFKNHEGQMLRAEEIRSGQALNAALLEVEAQKTARLREDLARDLHDGIGSITANLAILAALGVVEDGAEREKILKEIEAMALHGNREIRSLLGELDGRPVDWRSFLAELRRSVIPVNEAAGIATQWETTGEIPSGSITENAVAASLAKVLREAVHNMVKHSGARAAEIRFKFEPDRLVLRIADDGRGISETFGDGRGLRNMARRCDDLGGRFSRETDVKGTSLLISVPLPLSLSEAPRKEVA